MRRSIALIAAVVFPLCFVLPISPQTSGSAGEQNTAPLTAAYSRALEAKQWPQAVTAAQQLVALKTTALNLKMLANAQLYSGAAEAALSDYDLALVTAQLEKPTAGSSINEWKDELAQIYIGRGNALLKLKRTTEAIEAYNQAARFASNAGLAYFNVCAVIYNIGNTHDSAAACRKSIQADPTRANAWFILASDLFAEATSNAKGEIVASSETREALMQYLALAPDGPHASDVKAMLQVLAK